MGRVDTEAGKSSCLGSGHGAACRRMLPGAVSAESEGLLLGLGTFREAGAGGAECWGRVGEQWEMSAVMVSSWSKDSGSYSE